MRAGSNGSHETQNDADQTGGYDPPELVVLGTVAELTQLGSAPPDELLNDGSQA
jgi:hypothetical protein